jgi:nidogen-like
MINVYLRIARSITASLVLILAATPAFSAARRNLPGCSTSTLAANDDGSTAAVPIGFTINLFGTSYSTLFVNNNGNVTFDNQLSTFTPFDLTSTGTKIIAPFFADVDTRGAGSGLVHYGNDTVGGRNAFCVEWPAVGYFNSQTNKLNTFELVIIDRSDIGVGNFDFEFNYDQIQWETGGASGGSNGLGGSSARVGYSNGLTGSANASLELPGSAVNGALLDSGPNALISHSLNSAVLGRYVFSSRGGQIAGTPTNPSAPAGVPAMGTPALLLTGILLIGIVSYLRFRTV